MSIERGNSDNIVTYSLIWKDGHIDSFDVEADYTMGIKFKDRIDTVYSDLFLKVKIFIQYEENIILTLKTINPQNITDIFLEPNFYTFDKCWCLRVNKWCIVNLKIQSVKNNMEYNKSEAIKEALKFIKKLNIKVDDWYYDVEDSPYKGHTNIIRARYQICNEQEIQYGNYIDMNKTTEVPIESKDSINNIIR